MARDHVAKRPSHFVSDTAAQTSAADNLAHTPPPSHPPEYSYSGL